MDESSQETTVSWKVNNPLGKMLPTGQAGQGPRKTHGMCHMVTADLMGRCPAQLGSSEKGSTDQIRPKLHSPREAIYLGSRSFMGFHYFDTRGMKSFSERDNIMYKAIKSQEHSQPTQFLDYRKCQAQISLFDCTKLLENPK